MKSRVVRLIVSWLLVVCLALQLDCSGQSSLWSRAIDGSAVVMDEAWNSSRLAGGWSDLRTCVDVASARGSGVEMSTGLPDCLLIDKTLSLERPCTTVFRLQRLSGPC